ncbi:MAG: endonuclease/exonuclease/phosphatase family protein [Planctomycetes bacterium]|nr:endonuclease/exonuclease/phosphatase family protein [Planctomycetota bacterium]
MPRRLPFVLSAALLVALALLPAAAPRTGAALPAGAARVRIVSYNIKHGLGMDGRIDLDRTAAVVAGFDIVALQEVDSHNPRTGFRDQARHIAARNGLHHVFGANRYYLPFHLGAYGNAILSRYPILYSRNYRLFKEGDHEQRGMLRADVRIGSTPLHVYTVHLGLSVTERARQVAQVIEIARAVGGNRIILGDFNIRDYSAQLAPLHAGYREAFLTAGVGPRFTFRSDRPTIKIDHLFLNGVSARRSWVISSLASDHRPLAAELNLAR